MLKARDSQDERLVRQLSEAISGLTCSVNKLAGSEHDQDFRLLEATLRRTQRLDRRLGRLARAMNRLDAETNH